MELTKSEFEVCAYTASGLEPKETARILHKSYHTIASHIKTIRIKNNLRNVSELTMHFVLEFGDPRKFIAMIFLCIHVACIYGETRITRKTLRSTSNSFKKNYKRSKIREYYI